MSKESRQHGYTTEPTNDKPVPEPTYPERVRTLIYRNRVGTLSTLSKKHPDWPFGSMMPYGLDPGGRPIFLISTMAMHTHNIERDPRASLFVTQTDTKGDPLDASRVTLMGEVSKVPELELSEARELYLARYPNASYWVDFDDFYFYRMEIKDIYFVGGFGAMGWVGARDYSVAEVDPLCDTAGAIIEHMNQDHGDAIVLIARYFGGIQADEGFITSLDKLGFNARFKNGGEVFSRRVGFKRQVRDTKETREVLVEMVNEARGGG